MTLFSKINEEITVITTSVVCKGLLSKENCNYRFASFHRFEDIKRFLRTYEIYYFKQQVARRTGKINSMCLRLNGVP